MIDEEVLTRRVRAFSAVVLALLVVLAGRLWYLQVVQGERFARLADGNRIRMVRTSAPRGTVYDRNGVPLVSSRVAFTVSLVPAGLSSETKQEVILKLSSLLGMSLSEIGQLLEDDVRRYAYEPVRLARDIDPGTVIAIEEVRSELPGVMIEEELVRDYRLGEIGGQVFGYLGVVSKQELRDLGELGYRGSDLIGKTGLEKAYEGHLRGSDGGQQVEVNALGRPIRVLGTLDPLPGNDLVLTLDSRLEIVAHRALESQLEHLRDNTQYKEAKEGSVIALDPRNGDILAMVSLPSFDPNRLIQRTRGEYYSSLTRDPGRPLMNKAFQGEYSPGSAFKVITALAALETDKVTPTEKFYADGIGKYGKLDWPLRANPRQPPAGWVNIVGAMEQSSNDFFWEMGLRTGIHSIADWSRRFGLGQATGVPVFRGERPGSVPDPESKRLRFQNRDRSEQVWYESETMDVSIGQGALLVTPLQMALVYSAVAERGEIFAPRLVREVRSTDSQVLERVEPRVLRRVNVRESSWEAVVDGLVAVTGGSKGTARRAFAGFPVPVAGKTGTVQLEGKGKAPHAWFAGFAPAKDPEIVVVVLVEHGGGGASASAPVARKVLEAYFAAKNKGGRISLSFDELKSR